MVGEAALAKPEKKNKPFKVQLIELGLLAALLFFIVLIVYISMDSQVDRDYELADSQSQMGSTYRLQFNQLVSDIEAGNTTGIPTIDDAGVTYGTKINITKGSGDFANINQNWSTNAKSYTWYNYWGVDKEAKWSVSSYQYTIAYSKLIHQSSTLYSRSGVVKLFDRYSFVALGTYWAEKFGLSVNTGAIYRIYMDNGKTYDVICFDVASPFDPLSVNATNGKSLGHKSISGSNTSVIITEFDLLNLENNYPVLPKAGPNNPEMIYEDLLTIKDDPSHVAVNGSLNIIPEFEGNVVAIQLIDDPKVTNILNLATEEVKKYKSNN